MAQRNIKIEADDSRLRDFSERLKTDPALIQNLSRDAQGTLQQYGITVDDATARSLQSHLSNVLGTQPAVEPAPTVVVAIAVPVVLPTVL